jgi:hypothetical protein
MRALEITIFAIMVLTAPSLLGSLHLWGTSYGVCDGLTGCQVQTFLYNMANQTTLQQIDFAGDPGSMAWDIITFTITFVVYAVFWLLYFISLIVLIGPGMQAMFHVNAALALWLNVGIWFLWMLAIVQIKRGGISVESWR